MPSEPDDDQDEVAIDDGGHDDYGDHLVIPSSGHVQQKAPRQLSAKTRELFAGASKELRKQLDDEDDDLYDSVGAGADPVDDAAPVAGDVAVAVPAAAATPAPQAAQPTAAAPAPAPSLDPGIVAERERIAAARQDLDRREAELAERGKKPATALEAFRSRYFDDSSAAIRDLVKEVTSAANDDELKDAVSDLIVDLSANILNLSVSPEVKARSESRRALRAVSAHKAEIARDREKMAADQKAVEDKAAESRAVAAIGREFDAVKAEFPFLAVEDDAAGFIWDVIKTRHTNTGEQMSWRDAAKHAEDTFKRYTDAWVAKRRHLIAQQPAPAGTGAAPANGSGAPRGNGQQGGRRTVTNAMAAVPSAQAQSSEPDRPLTNEERRARTKANMRKTFRAQQSEEGPAQ